MQKEYTYTVDGLINGGGLISGWDYIRNNIFVGKWMSLYLGGLKPGGMSFKVGFYGTCMQLVSILLYLHMNAR